MRSSTLFAATALSSFALAENHVVAVGQNNLTFSPDSITAKNGDTVTFRFWPKNHSVAQATFAKPCAPSTNGAWSGFVPSSQGAASNEFVMTVTNESQPIWLYCSQGMHCQSGMVAVVNPPTSGQNTLERFKAAAMAASNNTSPTSTSPSGGNITTSGSQTSGSASPSSATGASSTTGAASTLEISGVAFTGILGMITYMFM